MLDKYIFGNVSRISPEAPIPVVEFHKEKKMLGGCGNVIRNLNNLGVKTDLVSAVGQDVAGNLLIEKLIERDVPVSNILRLNNLRTTEKMRIVADRQQVVRVDWNISNTNFGDDFLKVTDIARCIDNVDGVIISDYAKGVCSGSLLKEVIDASHQNNIPVLIDPKGLNWGKYKNASLITPNTSEAEAILGKRLNSDDDFEIACKKICSIYNIQACLITRGSDGMSFFCKDEKFHLKSNAREIFDVSGAGDTLISAMATGLVINIDYKEAAKFANQAAGIVVGHIGTSAVTTQELLNLN